MGARLLVLGELLLLLLCHLLLGAHGASERACEGEELELVCPTDYVVHVQRASYGRMTVNVCNPNGREFTGIPCMYDQTIDVVRRRCEGRPDCYLSASNDQFVSVCPPGYADYLQVSYECRLSNASLPADDDDDETTTTTTTTSGTAAPPTQAVSIATVRPAEAQASGPAATHCEPTEARGMKWPRTKVNTSARLSCPQDPLEFGSWHCGADGQWSTGRPDLSLCTSQWSRQIEAELGSVVSADKCVELMGSLQAVTQNTEQIYGGDTLAAAHSTKVVVERMQRLLQTVPADKRLAYVQEMNQRVAATVDNLLKADNAQAWTDLPSSRQTTAASDLLSAVETNSELVAHNLQSGDKIVEVSLAPIETYVKFPTESLLFGANVSSVQLPREAMTASGSRDEAAVIFAEFNSIGQFMQPQDVPVTLSNGQKTALTRNVASSVISAKVVGAPEHTALAQPLIITFRMPKTESADGRSCAFWSSSTSGWLTEGCHLQQANATHTTCACDHMTHFAVLIDVNGVQLDRADVLALSFITYVGCCVSIVCLLASLLAFCLFSSAHPYHDRLMVHANLCLCLAAAEATFIFGIAQIEHKLACSMVALCMHYLFLAAFAWMMLEGYDLYQLLVRVYNFGIDRRYYYLTGYGVPLLIVGLSGAFGHEYYGTGEYCWLSTKHYFIYTFVAPIVFVIVLNSLFLALAIRQVVRCKRNQHERRKVCGSLDAERLESISVWLKGACSMLVLLGLTWAFGLLYVSRGTVFWAYVFTVLNSLQGLFIFLFHVAWNAKLRGQARRWVVQQQQAHRYDQALGSSIPAGPPPFVHVFDANTGKPTRYGFGFDQLQHNTSSSPLPDSASTDISADGTQPYPISYAYHGEPHPSHMAQQAPLLKRHSGSYSDVKYEYVGYDSQLLGFVPAQQPAHLPITPSDIDHIAALSSGHNTQQHQQHNFTQQHRTPPRFDPPPPPMGTPPHTAALSYATSDYDRSSSAAMHLSSASAGQTGDSPASQHRLHTTTGSDSAYSDNGLLPEQYEVPNSQLASPVY